MFDGIFSLMLDEYGFKCGKCFYVFLRKKYIDEIKYLI